MSETKWTPGPWYATADPDRGTWWISQQPEGGTFWIAEALDGLMNDETEPNARLISAAPDLLALCARFEAYMLDKGDPWDGDDWQLMQDVRAAVKKATEGE